MRAIWKGAVSFGLVNVPVRLYAATQERDIRFHQVHVADGGRIRYRRVCETDGEEVSYDQIGKGYELPSGEVVILTDDDFEQLPLVSGHEIDVLEFVPAEQVDPVLFNKTYYLEPDAAAAKPYALLREALVSTDRMAIAKVALRSRETLAALRVRDNAIVLQTMLWPDEVREPDFGVLDQDVDLRPQELQMASSLIESMSTDFEPDQFTDAYRAALEELIAAKTEGREVVEPVAAAQPSGVIDLMTALQRSVEAARAAREGKAPSETSGSATGSVETSAAPRTTSAATAPVKKAAAKTAPAKTATAKKAPAKTAASAKATAAKSSTAKSATTKSATAKSSTAKPSAKKAAAADAAKPARRRGAA
ncbi:MAG: Ku protein [Actinomycetales bacterium]